MRAFLGGKWLRHPLHPILVHFPIGLWVLSLLLDMSSLMLGAGQTAMRAAFYTLALGEIMALLAAVPGLADWADIRPDHPAKRPATAHMALNLAAIAVYALNAGLRAGTLDATATPAPLVIMSAIGVLIIGVSGYLGGMIIYDDGIAVGRHRRRAGSPPATVRIRDAGPDQYVAVADDAALRDGETLRAEVRGTVMTLTRYNGQVCAFQEFCTHRFGPLSEGRIDDWQVECPWHRSRFDIRTGKVTNGPAKLDLKTFKTQVKDGKIMVCAPAESHPGEPPHGDAQ